MRVLLINTSERIGGAAIAASRLMESLKNHGIKAKLLVRDKCILRKIIHAVGVIAVSDADKLPLPDKRVNPPVVYTKPCKLFFFHYSVMLFHGISYDSLYLLYVHYRFSIPRVTFITFQPFNHSIFSCHAYLPKASQHHVIQADTGSQAY